MTFMDPPGALADLDAAGEGAVASLRAWVSEVDGARAIRRVDELGAVLRAVAVGAPPVDAAEVIAVNSSAVIDLLARHPAVGAGERSAIVFDVFGPAESRRAVERLRSDCLDALSRGVVAVIAGADAPDGIEDAILQTAFGADWASVVVREALLGRPIVSVTPVRRLPSLERKPAVPELPDLPLLDLGRLQQAVIWGTINDLIRAVRASGAAFQAYRSWAEKAHAHADGIESISPAAGCGGASVTITGAGFGKTQPDFTTVMFPSRFGCSGAKVTSWSDTEIVVVAPDNVAHGCVGFRVTAGDAPGDQTGALNDLRLAAGMLQSVLGEAFGAQGVLFGQGIVDSVPATLMPGLPCPPCRPAGTDGRIPNHFAGGVPRVRSFTVNGGQVATLHPGETITLAWEVDGATGVAISARTGEGSAWPAILPALPSILSVSGTYGPVPVDPDGVDDWEGEYVLEATNACGRLDPSPLVRVDLRERAPLFGIADTHVHLAAHLAHAGYGIWGRPHASSAALTGDAGLADALPHCDGPRGHGPGGVLPSLEGAGGHLVGGFDQFDGWPRHSTLAHQQAYLDWLRRAVDGGLRLVVCLAVNNELLATRMTELYGPNRPVDDISAINAQLAAAQAMVDFVDSQSGGPGRGWMEIARTPADARRIIEGGRLAIVLGVEVDSVGGWANSDELEQAATAAGGRPEDLIADMVQDLYDRGVRHVFPVHATNNAFGGPALFITEYDATNYFKNGSSFTVEEATPDLGISYRLDQDSFTAPAVVTATLAYHGVAAAKDIGGSTLAGVTLGGLLGGAVGNPVLGVVAGGTIAFAAAKAKYPSPPKPTNWSSVRGGHINAQGMTAHGHTLIDELMRRGMLVDIDHMGHKTTEEALTRCENNGYPVVSGHTGYRELKYGWRPSLPDPTAEYSKGVNDSDFGTANPRRLASEVDKSPAQLERIRRQGGYVATILNQRDVRDCGCGFVANDSAGSSKSFAQAFLYAHRAMHGRRVGMSTDLNGAAGLPGPRFGPQSSPAIANEDDYVVRRSRGMQLRAQQVAAQQGGVRYTTPLVDHRHHRFMDYDNARINAPFDAEQRDFWEAIAIWRSGTDPASAEQPPLVQRTVATQNLIINLAAGLSATSRGDLPIQVNFQPRLQPWPFFNVNTDEQLAAYLAAHVATDSVRSTDPARTRALVGKLAEVWNHWEMMEHSAPNQGTDRWTQQRFGPTGSGLYDANGAMVRNTAGRRDFDINMDGMGHYGLLPDFLQDLHNVGVQPQHMTALYRSAEDYVRVWERCEARRLP